MKKYWRARCAASIGLFNLLYAFAASLGKPVLERICFRAGNRLMIRNIMFGIGFGAV